MNVPAPAEHRRYCILTENMMEKGGGWVRQKTETLSERVAVKIRQYIIENEMRRAIGFQMSCRWRNTARLAEGLSGTR